MGNSYYKYRRSEFETNIRSGLTDTDSTIGYVILDPLLRYPVYTHSETHARKLPYVFFIALPYYFEWAMQTGLTASIATIGSVMATRMTIWLFDGVKKKKTISSQNECP
jgi:hypothetical protein